MLKRESLEQITSRPAASSRAKKGKEEVGTAVMIPRVAKERKRKQKGRGSGCPTLLQERIVRL